MTVAGAAVDVRGVSRLFRLGSEDVWAVRDVTLAIAPGEFLALVGRSGSGKTTLLNLIGGLDSPTEGAIELDGRDLHALPEKELTGTRRRDLGFVFQSFGLLPLLSAQENVELPLRIAGFPHGERLRRAREALDRVGLARRLSHRPYELSGGEQQRVAIARAVAIQPRLILADEPTGELDSATARVILALLRDLARETGATVVACTHDRLVMDVADRVEQLADGRLLSRLDDEPAAPLHSAPAVGAPVSGFEAAASERPATAIPTAESPPADDVARWARPGSRHD